MRKALRALVVTNPFDGLEKGSRITGEDEIEKVLDGPHAAHVIEADHPGAAELGPADDDHEITEQE